MQRVLHRRAGEAVLRQAVVALEGEDGAFRLLAHHAGDGAGLVAARGELHLDVVDADIFELRGEAGLGARIGAGEGAEGDKRAPHEK